MSALYIALLVLAAPLAFVAGWRARGRRDWRIEVPRALWRQR
jgi:hypothetical protein